MKTTLLLLLGLFVFAAPLLLLLGLFVFAAPARTPADRPGMPIIDDPEAYAVYSILIQGSYASGAGQIVISSSTVIPTNDNVQCMQPADEDAAVMKPLLGRFIAVSRIQSELESKFILNHPYTLVPQERLQSFFKPNATSGWDDFYAAYPHSSGIFRVSPVVFNAEKTIAIVYMEHGCGWLCGEGSVQILEKKNGSWAGKPWGGGHCSWVS